MTRFDATEIFRDAILEALDGAAGEAFGIPHGWKDQDLPTIFKMVDQLVLVVADRAGLQLTEPAE